MHNPQHLAMAILAAGRGDTPHPPHADRPRPRRPHRRYVAGALAATPLLAAVALAGASLVTGTPVAAPTRGHAVVAPSDQCNSPAAAIRSLKWPLCAGD